MSKTCSDIMQKKDSNSEQTLRWEGRTETPRMRKRPEPRVQSRQKLNSKRENIVLYSINLDVFSIAIEFLTTNDLDSVLSLVLLMPNDYFIEYQ